MNKTKLILPLATLFVLTSCGAKTKEVKTVWGNTWGYTNSVKVAFKLRDRQRIQDEVKNIDWDRTNIHFDGSISFPLSEKDRKVDSLLGSELVHYSNDYPVITKNRNFFEKNKIVVSSQEDKTVTIGDKKYGDASESTNKIIFFDNGSSSLVPAYDSESGIIEDLTAKYKLGEDEYTNCFEVLVFFNNEDFPVVGMGYIELAALA